MSPSFQFHHIDSVTVRDTYYIHAHFRCGTEKVYDMRKLADHPAFEMLFRHPAFIKSVKVEPGGYGISWNDRLDLSCEEIWAEGVTIDN